MNAATDGNKSGIDFEEVHTYELQKIYERRRRLRTKILESSDSDFAYVGASKTTQNTLNNYLDTLRKTIESGYSEEAWVTFLKITNELIDNTADGDVKGAIVHWLAGILEFESPNDDRPESTTGLALSGGGIRSAAFNLGVLQALDSLKLFKFIDYMSTVSGGGYIGSSLTWFLHHMPHEEFPFKRHLPTRNSKERIEYLRRHASYLTPGEGLGRAALFAGWARGIVMNLTILVPLFLFALWLMTLGVVTKDVGAGWAPKFLFALQSTHWKALLFMALASIPIWVYRVIVDQERKWFDRYAIPRMVLWAGLFSLIYYQSLVLSNLWTTGRDYFLIWPPLIVAIVFSIAQFSPNKDLGRVPSVIIEVAAWSVVYWALFVALKNLPVGPESPIINDYPVVFLVLLFASLFYIGKLAVNFVFYTVLSVTSARLKFQRHRQYSVQYGDLLVFGLVCGLLGAVPLIDSLLKDVFICSGKAWEIAREEILSFTAITGAISTFFGWLYRTPTREQRGIVALLLRLGLILLIASAILISYRVVLQWHGDTSDHQWWFYASWIAFILLIANSDLNYVSMHRYYRNRLEEAFLFVLPPGTNCDNLDLHHIDISKTGAPYHLINTNLVTVGSNDEKLRLRGGDSFTFSPGYIGCPATNYSKTSESPFSAMNVATAMAISGAAVDPNTGATRSWPLRVVMTWLNVRLGYWCAHPDEDERWTTWPLSLIQSSWIWLITREMAGRPREDWSYVRLSDGGHFENLGLYELVRRRCKLIIVSDAGADPSYEFSDLAIAVERVRADFDVDIEISLEDLIPNTTSVNSQNKKGKVDGGKIVRMSKNPFALGKIIYDNDEDNAGILIYIKSTLFSDLPQDVMGYSRQNATFPDQSTANQFYTEEQFEAYRELGYRAAISAFSKHAPEMHEHFADIPQQSE